MSWFKKIFNTVAYLVFLSIATLFLLELSYRFYIVDFYKSNLDGLNPTLSIKETGQKTTLVIGDSFTADPQSYVKYLRKTATNHQVINAAVPGTCIKQHELFAKKRIQDFKPDILIYQIYVGNDLFEFRHPVDSEQISFVRKMYWWLSDRILILGFINAKLPALRQAIKHDLPIKTDPKALEYFSAASYSPRSKLQFKAEPTLLENTIQLNGERKKDMAKFTRHVNNLFKKAPKKCAKFVLVMPHCVQINDTYVSRLQTIGAEISHPKAIQTADYPFIQYLKDNLQPEVQIINPLKSLKQKDEIAPVYYSNDPHLNAFGQEVVAREVVVDVFFDDFNEKKSK